jgi:hypothetical protein
MSDTSAKPGPLPLSQVLAEECAALQGFQPEFPAPPPENAPQEEKQQAEKDRLNAMYESIHRHKLNPAALCISGGGIRSATFGLGLLQGLAQRGMLGKFDYLSTVSGGGYIGSWLTAWIQRHPQGFAGVCQELAVPLRHPLTSEQEPVSWLRTYSNYLSPKLGLASADSWTLIGTYLRNLLLNWLVLIPLLLALLAVPRLYISVAKLTAPKSLLFVCLALGLVLTLVSLTYIHLFRPGLAKYRAKWRVRVKQTQPNDEAGTVFEAQSWFLNLSLIPIMAASILLTLVWAWVDNSAQLQDGQAWLRPASAYSWKHFALATAALNLLSWLIAFVSLGRFSEGLGRGIGEAALIVLSGALGGVFAWVALTQETPYGSITDSPRIYACLAPVSFVGAFLLAATIFVGLASHETTDEDREWWARSGSWILISILVWSGFGVLVAYGPSWLEQFPLLSLSSGSLAGLIASWLGFSPRTAPEAGQGNSAKKPALPTNLSLSIIAPIAVLFVLAAGSWVTSWTFSSFPAGMGPWEAWNQDPHALKEPLSPAPWGHQEILIYTSTASVALFILVMTLTSIGFSRFININKFSLHSMYRNRLIRAYLGASRLKRYKMGRRPNRFTGFDPDDNFQLTELATSPVQKPFHVINVALNLVHGDNLAWQQRKAQSMTLSPLHCGSFASDLGYRPSSQYGMNVGVGRAVTLGTALAISGAAASPNMGYHSSPAVTFLLTLFNIRLGWWLGNPGKAGDATFNKACPKVSVIPLVQEALGFTDAGNPYVYLSDGGHFENLGLYEMVLRRCHYILVSDAGCDQESRFQDLGNAIRKIRIDLGIDIDIDLSLLRPKEQRRVTQHHAIGTIHYDRVDSGAPKGVLIYLKPSLTGNESADVLEYAAHHTAFPHEPTSDQFFDESQFESYRRLGEHIAMKVFDADVAGEAVPLPDTFRTLHGRSHAH